MLRLGWRTRFIYPSLDQRVISSDGQRTGEDTGDFPLREGAARDPRRAPPPGRARRRTHLPPGQVPEQAPNAAWAPVTPVASPMATRPGAADGNPVPCPDPVASRQRGTASPDSGGGPTPVGRALEPVSSGNPFSLHSSSSTSARSTHADGAASGGAESSSGEGTRGAAQYGHTVKSVCTSRPQLGHPSRNGAVQ